MNFNVLSRLVITTYSRNTNFYTCRKFGNICLTSRNATAINSTQLSKIQAFAVCNAFFRTSSSVYRNRKTNVAEEIPENISDLQVKKRRFRKKRSLNDNEEKAASGFWNIKALATAEAYNLEKLTYALIEQQLYMPDTISTTTKCLYALDFDEHGDAAIENAIKNPEKYVLKPQREGGCNNLYGNEIKEFLESIKDQKERVAWILMKKIYPPMQYNYMIRPGKDSGKLQSVVSELGIFGAILGDEKEIFINKQVGHMLRTKLVNANEGGVATGAGACDSLFLID